MVYGVQGSERIKNSSEYRQVCMYLIRERTGLSFQKIGRLLKGHYSTVMYSCRRIKGFREVYPEIREKIERIEKLLDKTE